MVNNEEDEGLDFSHSFDKSVAPGAELDTEQSPITTESTERRSKKSLFIMIGVLMCLIIAQLFLSYYRSNANMKSRVPIPPEGLKIFTK